MRSVLNFCMLIVVVVASATIAESSDPRSFLCSPADKDDDLQAMRQSIAAAAQIPVTRVEVLSTPTEQFRAYCYRCVTAGGGLDTAADTRLKSAGEFKQIGSEGTVPIVDITTTGLDLSQWSAKPPSLKEELIGGEFTTMTLVLVAVLGAIVLGLAICAGCVCRRSRRQQQQRKLERAAYEANELDVVGGSGKGDELASYSQKQIHPVQDTSVVPGSSAIRAVLPLYAVSEETIDRVEGQGYQRMENLQQLSPDHLSKILDDVDVPREQRERLEVAVLSFTVV